jgi:hypothetical protein
MLQALGLLALRPEFHDVLLKYDLPDTVMSLILPGEELYYTNQTTKYSKYVKHLAARILVYLGLFSKLSNKLNLFDILGGFLLLSPVRSKFTSILMVLLELNPEAIEHDKPQTLENNFIHHMAIGDHVISSAWMSTAAISIEKLIDNILKVKKKKKNYPYLFVQSLTCDTFYSESKEIKNSNSAIIQFGFNNKNENLMYNLSYLCSVVHPLIVLRVLEHRLFTPLSRKKTEVTYTHHHTPTGVVNKTKINTSSSFPINYDLLINNSNLEGSAKLSSLRKSTEGYSSIATTPVKAPIANFKPRESANKQRPKTLKHNSSFLELNEMTKRSTLATKGQRSRYNSIKGVSRKRANVKSSKSNSNLKADSDISAKNFNFSNFV